LFNNKKDDENDFCESYKSEILGTKPSEEENSLFSSIVKILTILILLVIIIGVSFYGYNYFMKSQKLKNITLPPVSMQISDDDLVVEAEEPNEEKVIIEENISLPLIVSSQGEEVDIEEMANDVKIAIAKSEVEEENESKEVEEISKDIKSTAEFNISKKELPSLEVATLAPEAQYLEELADLSKEIDKERKK
jgi:cell division protein YceG involved in septum cleavage